MRVLRFVLFVTLAFLPVPFTFAQTGGAEAVFRAQLVDLHSKAVAVLDRIERTGPRGISRQQAREEIFALVRLVHRLEEEAGATNLQFIQRGQPSSKTLLLVQQAAKAVDDILSSLDSYLESDDRAFLGFARDYNALA